MRLFGEGLCKLKIFNHRLHGCSQMKKIDEFFRGRNVSSLRLNGTSIPEWHMINSIITYLSSRRELLEISRWREPPDTCSKDNPPRQGRRIGWHHHGSNGSRPL